ncbi:MULTISPECIES: PadR family transcriptional regulator [unclassified Microbacterium]|uniref:PadR family transcriptional regulator n=1 Tax=unclassified Microbacterium TaxID=2609290 RepID=UPI00097F4869|nr:PadR family transcriptional regulator [Microbacterium sp. JB110]RCS57736.1 PadR family transcriptional regulator [Microbacterium sp. JB110]SJM67744.1 Transcriptional regulator, PadR family [Frigoribacterium sp. JB110]
MGKQETELLKGVLEGVILELLRGRAWHGYDLTTHLQELGFTDVVEGTVYALLVRIERRELVDVEKVPSQKGPPRKVYTLNAAGVERLDEFWTAWGAISGRLDHIRNGGN